MKPLIPQSLKKKFLSRADDDRKLRGQVKKIIAGTFELKEVNITSQAVILVAADKATAQELFFQKEALKREFKREIVIR